jgi:hypothetical protein
MSYLDCFRLLPQHAQGHHTQPSGGTPRKARSTNTIAFSAHSGVIEVLL